MPDNLSNHLSRHIVTTEDGSTSIEIPEMNEMYHSRKGARTESVHVYINHGLNLVGRGEVSLLEVGLGTGLNAILSFYRAQKLGIKMDYVALEPFPLNSSEVEVLNFDIGKEDHNWTKAIHNCSPDKWIQVNDSSRFLKHHARLEDYQQDLQFDLIYFDAFAPNKQASPWVKSNILKCYEILKPNGILTTYCAQGQFKRNLAEAGFKVTNPEGPMGKREITVAYK